MKRMTYKLISSLLVLAVLILSVSVIFPVSALGAEAVLYVINQTTGMYTERSTTSPTSVKITDIYKYTVIAVSDISDGWGKVYLQGTAGYINLANASPYNDDPSDSSQIDSIRIEHLPYKTVYTDGETFSAEGIAVSATLKNDQVVALKGFDIIVPSLNLTRFDLNDKEQTVIVKYGPGLALYAGFPITVKRLPIDTLKVDSLPKLEYKEGERISLTGLKVQAKYTDGTAPKDITNELINTATGEPITALDGKILAPGTYNYEYVYKYNDKKINLQFKVNPRKLIRIRVASMPTYNVLKDENNLDLTGFILAADYDNGTTDSITPGRNAFYYNENNKLVEGENHITVTYGGFTISFDITLEKLAVKEIEIKQLPDRVIFQLGEEFKYTGLVLTLHYNDGTRRDITDGFTVSTPDMNTLGAQDVTVSIYGLEKTYEIMVTDKLYKLGDVNNDTKVDAADARLVLRHVAKLSTLSEIQQKAADVDNDGKVSASDARIILRVAAKLQTL